jgi:hypothetical protein
MILSTNSIKKPSHLTKRKKKKNLKEYTLQHLNKTTLHKTFAETKAENK